MLSSFRLSKTFLFFCLFAHHTLFFISMTREMDAWRKVLQVYCTLILALSGLSATTPIKYDCNKMVRSGNPQSTFEYQKKAGTYQCPTYFKRGTFESVRSNSTVSAIDWSNMTVRPETDTKDNSTTIRLCSSGKSSEAYNWTSGSYCLPLPSDSTCNDGMVLKEVVITAKGRRFKCSSDAFMSQCTNDTFTLKACCPENTTATEYNSAPLNDATFYLFRISEDPSNTSSPPLPCQKLYSFQHSMESFVIPNATISQPPQTPAFFGHQNGSSVVISFCKYTTVQCVKEDPEYPYALYGTYTCNRYKETYCALQRGYVVQPKNNGSTFFSYCYPNATYHSNSVCGKQCPEIPAISDASLTTNSTAPLTTVSVICNDGYVLEGNGSTTCTKAGNWSHDISGTTCKFVTCPKIKKQSYRVFDEDGSKNPYGYGHNLTFKCRSPNPPLCVHFATFKDEISVTCLANGSWSDDPKCIFGHIRNCTSPGNTSTSYTLNDTSIALCKQILFYHCRDHHKNDTIDSMNMQCGYDGNWNTSVPECNTIYCDKPNLAITNGSVSSPNYTRSELQQKTEFHYGDVLDYECDPMFMVVGYERTRCQVDGTWEGGSNSTCQLIVCPDAPLVIDHGKRVDDLVNQTSYHLGDEVVYECESDRYELSWEDTVVCNNSAMWNPFLPSCNEVTCGLPPLINNGTPESGPYKLDHQYGYNCNEGFRLSNNSKLTCKLGAGGAIWDGSPPLCDKVYCAAPPPISHGAYSNHNKDGIHYYSLQGAPSTDDRYDYGVTFNYSCDEGYNASVAYTTSCSGLGTWSPAPECHAVHCYSPDIPYSETNGTTDTLFNYGTEISVQCEEHARYAGTQLLRCSNNGVWISLDGKPIISCDPVVLVGSSKWVYVGVGIALLILIVGIVIFYFAKKRREAKLASDNIKFVRNPSYIHDGNGMGFENMAYESHSTNDVRFDKNRLVLDKDNTYSTPQPSRYNNKEEIELSSSPPYATLHGRGKPVSSDPLADDVVFDVSEPREGFYNTLPRLKSKVEEDTNEDEEEDYYNTVGESRKTKQSISMQKIVSSDLKNFGEDDIYNVPSNPTLNKNTNPYQNQQPITPMREFEDDLGVGDEEDEGIYNIPTLGRNKAPVIQVNKDDFMIGYSEVNELYSSQAAAEICGTPIETDFDNIIYDNI